MIHNEASRPEDPHLVTLEFPGFRGRYAVEMISARVLGGAHSGGGLD